jgi:branched-chain amino acid transport system permease protein
MLALQLLVNGVLLGGAYMLIAQSLNLIFGVMGVVNFAHGAFIATAALFTFWFTTHFHLNPFLGLPIVVAGMLIAGAVVQRLLLEPLAGLGRKVELLSLMITFGLSYILVNVALQVWGSDYVSLPYLQGNLVAGGVTLNMALVVAGLCGGIFSAFFYFWLGHTNSGKTLLAVAQNQIGAVTCGIDVGRVRLAAFALGAGLAGVAGVLLILVIPIAAQSADNLTILAFVTIALGGLGDYLGVAVAALGMGVAQSLAGYYLGGDAENVLPYILLILIMAMRPHTFGRAAVRGR